MSECIKCLRYIFCCPKIQYGERVRSCSESDSDPETPDDIDTFKKSVYKKVSTWSAYIGREQIDARDKKIRDLDKFLNEVEPSDEFVAV